MSIFSAELRRRAVIGFCAAWLTLFGAVLAGACLSGCGASALQVHATVADTVGQVITASGDELLDARQRDLDTAHQGAAYREDAAAAVAAVRLRYEPAVASYDALRLTHDAWVETLLLAAAGDLDDAPRWAALAARCLRAYDGWALAARSLGLDVPRVPPMLMTVAAMALPAVTP
ncbi:MAG: hypothetical protein WC211_00935 [Dehalococcoidia bacterium]